MTHHPHVHMIVPGGGIAPDGRRWISSRPAFLLPVRVLGKLFRRLFLTRLIALHDAGRLAFFGSLAHSRRPTGLPAAPVAGPEEALGGLCQAALRRARRRCSPTCRATPTGSPSRTGACIAFDETGVTFRYKDYRRDGADRQQVMTLAADEFIRRFLLHVLPRGFHRIRHYGLLAGSARKASLALARELLDVAAPPDDDAPDEPVDVRPPCPCCGGRMIVIETFERWQPAARTAGTHATPNRETRAMTRHGSSMSAWPPHARPVNGMLMRRVDDGSPAPAQPHRITAAGSMRRPRSASCSRSAPPTSGRSHQAQAHPKAQIPIAHRLRPAGSCMRDFRTLTHPKPFDIAAVPSLILDPCFLPYIHRAGAPT